MTIAVSREILRSPIEFNLFDSVPNDLILSNIAPYLSPEAALSARLVDKRFAVLFGDNRIWRLYYRALGLEVPEQLPDYYLARKFTLWACLQKAIDPGVAAAGAVLSSCIALLILPELSPLHAYAIKTLKENSIVPSELSVEELLLRVARGDEGFEVDEGTRIEAIKALAKRAADPKVRQALLSVINTYHRNTSTNEPFHIEAVNGLRPYLNEPEVEHAILYNISRSTVWAVLDFLIAHPNPKVLDKLINRCLKSFYDFNLFVCNHLHDANLVKLLVEKITVTNDSHTLRELAEALRPVADQEPVQRALCQKLVDFTGAEQDLLVKDALEVAVYNAPLTEAVKAAYRDRLPELQKRAEPDLILDPAKELFAHRKPLLKALASQDEFTRLAAATQLAPFVTESPDILAAFLNRIQAKDLGKVGIVVVSALAKMEYREDICTVLIEEGSLDGRLDGNRTLNNVELRLATVQTLGPFVDKPQVRQALLQRLKSDKSADVRCALIDIFAPQIEREDVRALFLEVQERSLWLEFTDSMIWKIAAIEKLGSFTHLKDVREALLNLLNRSHWRIKAACIRALCSDPQKRLIRPDKIFSAYVAGSSPVRKEARRVLALWTQ